MGKRRNNKARLAQAGGWTKVLGQTSWADRPRETKPPAGKQLPTTMWDCKGCGFKGNYAGRAACFRCGAAWAKEPKPHTGQKPPAKEPRAGAKGAKEGGRKEGTGGSVPPPPEKLGKLLGEKVAANLQRNEGTWAGLVAAYGSAVSEASKVAAAEVPLPLRLSRLKEKVEHKQGTLRKAEEAQSEAEAALQQATQDLEARKGEAADRKKELEKLQKDLAEAQRQLDEQPAASAAIVKAPAEGQQPPATKVGDIKRLVLGDMLAEDLAPESRGLIGKLEATLVELTRAVELQAEAAKQAAQTKKEEQETAAKEAVAAEEFFMDAEDQHDLSDDDLNFLLQSAAKLGEADGARAKGILNKLPAKKRAAVGGDEPAATRAKQQTG